ncbi:MAG: imidazolonepropionase [Acetobacteraceae bacterium]
MLVDRLWTGARLATMDPARRGLGIVEHGAIAEQDGRIVYAGTMDEMPKLDAAERIDCAGRWITPGLIDCHTHLVHGGNRAAEFELRLQGATYEELARSGGGIAASVKATRAASVEELITAALPRLDALLAEGATTLEIKSGYGLETNAEMRQLLAARALARHRRVEVTTTFLGLHALPEEAKSDRALYIEAVAETMLPAICAAGLADAVDGFCEHIAFSPAEIRSVFAAAGRHQLPVKLHADQLSNGHGALLAAESGALSADHLEYADEQGVAAMARSGTIAVLLPGAFYFLRETRAPPIALFRSHGVPMALATDCNPGTSPLTSLLLVMNLAATLFRMTVEECLLAVTRNAARALGKVATHGVLVPGAWCDLAIWDIARPAELVYRMGFNPLFRRIWRGR